MTDFHRMRNTIRKDLIKNGVKYLKNARYVTRIFLHDNSREFPKDSCDVYNKTLL